MKIKKFNLFAVLFSLFWIIITVISCLLLWNYLKVYEQSTPVHAGRQILELYKQGKYAEAMEKCGVAEDGMFTCEVYEEYIKSSLGENLDSVKIYEGIQDEEGNRILEMLGKSNNPLKFYLNESPDSLKYGLSSFSLTQCEIETLSYSFTFPEDFNIKVNGNSIDTSSFTRDVVESFDVFETKNDVPYTKTGTLKGFISEPEVTVDGLEPDRYKVALDNGSFTVTVYPSADKVDAIGEKAAEVGQAFAKYLFNDSSFTKLKDISMAESSSFQRLKYYDKTWIPKHSKCTIENLKTDNYVQYSDNSYSADVSFGYSIVTRLNKSKTYDCEYKVFLMDVGGELKMAAIEIN